MCHFENILLENCLANFKPTIHWWYINDHVKFKNDLNKQHKNIKFTSAIEKNENNKFVTSISCKPIFSDVFANCESFIPDMHKCGLTETLFHRSFGYLPITFRHSQGN